MHAPLIKELRSLGFRVLDTVDDLLGMKLLLQILGRDTTIINSLDKGLIEKYKYMEENKVSNFLSLLPVVLANICNVLQAAQLRT